MRHKKITIMLASVLTVVFALLALFQGAAALSQTDRDGGHWVRVSGAPESVERTAGTAASGANDTWYLAEGCTDYGFQTLVILQNSNPKSIRVNTTFMTDQGPYDVGNETIEPSCTVAMDPSNILGEANFSVKITSLGGEPIAVERWMMWPDSKGEWVEGHSSIGVTAPSKVWYLAEGSSKWGFDCWVLVQNPNPTDASVELLYMIEGVGPKAVAKTVPANSRSSFFMADDIGFADASVKVSGNVPVIAERAMYRNGKREGHGSIGTVAPATDYYLAEGTTDWGFTTYVLIQNPDPAPNEVTVTYMTEGGPIQDPKFTMPPNSRKTIRINDAHPGLDLSTRVHGTKPLIAERAMYWNSGYGEACHDSVGLSAPHQMFYLPGGATSEYDAEAQQADMETYTLIQNPNNQTIQVEVNYLDLNKIIVVAIGPNSRSTCNMADDVGLNESSGIIVESKTSGCDIMVEKSNYIMKRTLGMETIGAYVSSPIVVTSTDGQTSGAARTDLLRSMFQKVRSNSN